jgi:tRNA G18 (ribose-2'-O)-methylase SpoU
MRKLKHDEIPRPDPAEITLLPKHPISVIVESVRSIYNVGSIFRTSDAARIEHVYLTGISGTPEHRGLHKTALGAQDTVPWSFEPDSMSIVNRLRNEGYTIAVLEITDRPTLTHEIEPGAFPLCLIVGNEVTGVSAPLVEAADLALEIPQFGAKQSLNVSVAYGIAVFDLVRRFRANTMGGMQATEEGNR